MSIDWKLNNELDESQSIGMPIDWKLSNELSEDRLETKQRAQRGMTFHSDLYFCYGSILTYTFVMAAKNRIFLTKIRV